MNIFGSYLFPKEWFSSMSLRQKNFWWKCLVQTYFRGNDLATKKIFQPKNVWWKFLVHTSFRGNDFATIKIFDKTFSNEFFGSNLFLRKWFCNHKKFSTKKFWMKIYGSNLCPRKWFCNHKTFSTKNFQWNFWFKPISEEMILQP